MTLPSITKCWVMQMDWGHMALWSYAYSRKDCIRNYLEGLGEENTPKNWKEKRNKGARPLRVNIHFELITPATAPEKETTL